jgi:hypothetical protein
MIDTSVDLKEEEKLHKKRRRIFFRSSKDSQENVKDERSYARFEQQKARALVVFHRTSLIR